MTQGNHGGRPPKLTQSLIDSLLGHLRTCTPSHFACSANDISEETLRTWRRRATVALDKKPNERSQHERMCIRLFDQMDKAVAQGFMNGWATIAMASRPSTLVKTTTTTKPDGTVTVVDETKQVPGDWRATAFLLTRRFKEEMALNAEPAPMPEPVGISTEEALAAIDGLYREDQLRLVQGGNQG